MAKLRTILTARTKITPFTLEEIHPEYIGWLNDPETVKFSRQRFTSHDRESCIDFFNRIEDSPNFFSAIFDSDEKHIGNISVSNDLENQVSDMSILIGCKSRWGKGYGNEAWSAVMEELFKLGVRIITGGCMAKNASMIRVMKKSGMKLYFVREKYFLLDGEYVDSVHYYKENIA